jgi:Protein of unknown function (DUF2939)
MLRALLIIISVLCFLYVGLAGRAVYRVVNGLTSGDAPVVADYLDAPAVKKKLKDQLNTVLANRSRNGLGRRNDLGAQIGAGLIAALGPSLVNNIVDHLVTPEGLAAILSSVERRTEPGHETATEIKPDLFAIAGQFRLLGIDRFELVDKSGGALTFSFRDWAWRITEIQAPPALIERLIR